ncbi:conserved oligomeric Golgi complex subunit 3-like isoform X2 [Corticium candelabrum]|uniref:conserved oligomeric Golgi complex subunit 3-like isoform X2 n=1 Tax=Corticium candelabrum TaxID=121492 RepID=UPI002E25FD9F|nr:conserved oligomeric Golgi complex subunit 3-like isoform X2 [Corticium candelabrum]
MEDSSFCKEPIKFYCNTVKPCYSDTLTFYKLAQTETGVVANGVHRSRTDQEGDAVSLLAADERIETAQQFFAWYQRVEVAHSQQEESKYTSCIEQLTEYRKHCDTVLQGVSATLERLEEMQKQQLAVSTKTNALHEACDQLLQDQTKLVNVAESIRSKLAYFDEVEELSQKLNSSTFSVSDPTFVPKLTRMDECIAFLASHPSFKELPVYQVRFQQCLHRALSLIRVHVVNQLKGITQQVQPTKGVIVHHTDSAFTLYYGKFRTVAPRIKSLMEQVEQRCRVDQQYMSLLQECQQCYVAQRQHLLIPTVTVTLQMLLKEHNRDHCLLFRGGCSFMVRLCQDEHQLYYHFFSLHSAALESLLDSLSCLLYDVLRPHIIHIHHLETLAELCSILKVEMLEDHVQQKPAELSVFGSVVAQMLEDIQERLVYRAQLYVNTDIKSYNPSPGDLAYPEKLQVEMKTSKGKRGSTSLESGSEGYDLAAADQPGMWYPTLRRTLMCLSKLYRCINKPIFEGIAQEALAECIQSLKVASNAIVSKKSAIDGQLFLIKHLLILKEQIAPFDVTFAVKEVSLDFTKLRVAAKGLLSQGSRLFALNQQNAFLEFLLEGQPQLTENYLDSKKDVDNQLKRLCEEFIETVSHFLAESLKLLLAKVDAVTQMAAKSGSTVQLKTHVFATPEKVHEVVSENYKNLRARLPPLLEKMSLYLANKDTEYILFKPIKANVHQAYRQLNKIVTENFGEEEQQIIGCPSTDEVSVLVSMN